MRKLFLKFTNFSENYESTLANTKDRYLSQANKMNQSNLKSRVRRCEKQKLLNSIKRLRKANLERIQKMEETANKLDIVKGLRGEIETHLSDHSG